MPYCTICCNLNIPEKRVMNVALTGILCGIFLQILTIWHRDAALIPETLAT
jgi:hypothetical protein